MINRIQALDLNDRLQELMVANSQGFGHAAIESDPATYPGREIGWHWHEQFEFGTVAAGSLELSTKQSTRRFSAGEGYFINANVLHSFHLAPGCDHAVIRTHLFDGALISGGNPVMHHFIRHLDSHPDLDLLPLDPKVEQQQTILRHTADAFDAARQEEAGYQMAVCAHLMQAWLGVYRIALPRLGNRKRCEREGNQRIKAMLTFIHDHYQEPIRTEDIAAAASICSRECYRCFRQTLNTTPTAYLTRHRVHHAAELLRETAAPVTEIALSCGFSGSSYFGKVFFDLMGCTPRQYRKKENP